MKTLIQTVVLLLLVVFAGCTERSQPVKNDLLSLQKEISIMIKQLSSDSYEDTKNFIKRYAISKEMKDKLKEENIDELTKKFIKSKKKNLLKALEYVIDKKPSSMPDEVTYTFEVPKGYFRKDKARIGFYWDTETSAFYIRN